MRPKRLKETMIAMCFMNVAGFVFIDPAAGSVSMQAVVFGVIIAATFAVLRFYWLGKNWARILVLMGAVLSLINLAFIGSASVPAAMLIGVEAVFGVLMLWWLNTSEVKTYFGGKNRNMSG